MVLGISYKNKYAFFPLIGQLNTFAVEGQKWEQIKLVRDDQEYYLFRNPSSDRYLTALDPEKNPDLTITGIIMLFNTIESRYIS